jgi:hypothetical protein
VVRVVGLLVLVLVLVLVVWWVLLVLVVMVVVLLGLLVGIVLWGRQLGVALLVLDLVVVVSDHLRIALVGVVGGGDQAVVVDPRRGPLISSPHALEGFQLGGCVEMVAFRAASQGRGLSIIGLPRCQLGAIASPIRREKKRK